MFQRIVYTVEQALRSRHIKLIVLNWTHLDGLYDRTASIFGFSAMSAGRPYHQSSTTTRVNHQALRCAETGLDTELSMWKIQRTYVAYIRKWIFCTNIIWIRLHTSPSNTKHSTCKPANYEKHHRNPSRLIERTCLLLLYQIQQFNTDDVSSYQNSLYR